MPTSNPRLEPLTYGGSLSLAVRHRTVFLLLLFAGTLLRLFFVAYVPGTQYPDTVWYVQLGTNWLQHGVYGGEENGVLVPSYTRLPGYPLFLAATFAAFGTQHYLPVLLIQTLVDLTTCLIIALTALEMFGEGGMLAAFAIAALCPFTANYVAVALPETLSIFFTALTLWSAVKGLAAVRQGSSATPGWWVLCGLGIAAATLLRPDGGILLIALWAYLFLQLTWTSVPSMKTLRAGAVTTLLVVTALTPWTLRNWALFGEFQPIAPRYCNDIGEYVPIGFIRWFKTWPVEFADLYDIYWRVSSDPQDKGQPVEVASIPPRAFDDPSEKKRVLQLFKEVNAAGFLTPEMDARFGEIAQERIDRDPLRYYLWLPFLRVMDMWLRPRTEELGQEGRWHIAQHWWHLQPLDQALFSLFYALLNLLLLLTALLGMVNFRGAPGAGLLIGFVLIRSAFLATMENPEPRYVLECYPAILVFAGAQLYALWKPRVPYGGRQTP
jgi:4-amino-4-deoxy-L-arabinose transferase-like glycosyltransferase